MWMKSIGFVKYSAVNSKDVLHYAESIALSVGVDFGTHGNVDFIIRSLCGLQETTGRLDLFPKNPDLVIKECPICLLNLKELSK